MKTSKNEFDWLKTIFFIKKGIRDHFWKVSSDLTPFWQVTIFHTRLPHKPNHGLGLRQGWNSENLKNEFEWLKTIFFMKKGIRDHFWKVSSDFKQFWQVTIFHTRLPTNQIMDWDLDKGEILKTYKNESWMAQNDIFHEKRHTRSFLKSFKWFQAILKVTIFHTRLPHKPNHGLGLRQGRNSENLQNEFDWLETIFFVKEGLRDHFCKVSSDLKPFWQVTIFHTRLPHKPNHGLRLRQGRNSENLQKWIWLAWNYFFRERRLTRSFLQSFKWFKAILTSYHISH